MSEDHHKQIPIQVTVDVDEGIADLVLYLNTIPGVRTLACCQGTIGEGGQHPYPPQVMVTWADDTTFATLERGFDLSEISHAGNWACLHPRAGWVAPATVSSAVPVAFTSERELERLRERPFQPAWVCGIKSDVNSVPLYAEPLQNPQQLDRSAIPRPAFDLLDDEQIGRLSQGLGFAGEHPSVRAMAREIEHYRAVIGEHQ